MRKSNAIFILGLNGAGKSTIRDDIAASTKDVIIIDPDKIAKEYNCTSFKAGKIAINLFKEAIKNNSSFLIESTLSSHSVINQIKTAKENNYSVRAYFIGLKSLNTHIDRVKSRVKNGGHNIDENIIKRRFNKTYCNIRELFPIVNYLKIIDNSFEFEPQLKIVNGKVKRGKTSNDWVNEYVIRPYTEYKINTINPSKKIQKLKENSIEIEVE